MLLLFLLSIIGVIFIFFAGGIEFFNNDTENRTILVALGMLTFISIFFGFVIKDSNVFLKSFSEIVQEYEDGFSNEFKEITKEKQDLKY